MRNLPLLLLLFACPFVVFSQEKIDASMMQKIRNQGLNNSQVMDIAWNFTDGSGPRVTSSPGFFRAANYAKQTLEKWGVKNVRIEPWGDFGKGWELEKSYVAMTAPYYKPLIAFPKVWTTGTNGLQNAEVVVISAKDSASLDVYRGKLKGKIVIVDRGDMYNESFKADAARLTDAELDSMANAKPSTGGRQQNNGDTAAMRRRRDEFRAQQSLANGLRNLLKTEGIVATFSTNPRNHDGTVFVQGATGNPYKMGDAESVPDLALSLEDYNTILRTAKRGIPVRLDVDVRTRFKLDDTKAYNVIGEIPGTDLKDEVVMLGAHLDSWQGATGATDNASGSAVMMEVMRILKTLGVQPRRTIRIALWSGEEQGLLGSRGYVKNNFADRSTMQTLPAHEKLSAYYNIDNGTGKVRGIYAQGNEGAAEIFKQWLVPFYDLGAKTVTLTNTGSTDHIPFDEVGLPGFQFIQDDIDYFTRTHHSNMDSYEHLMPEDLKQISTIVAAFVYNTAMRDEKMPRKEMPKPRQAGDRGF
jgi:carboxypeptidase Q